MNGLLKEKTCVEKQQESQEWTRKKNEEVFYK